MGKTRWNFQFWLLSPNNQTQWKYWGAETGFLTRHWVCFSLPEVVDSTRAEQDRLCNSAEIFIPFSQCWALKPGMNLELQISSAEQGQRCTGNAFAKMSQKLMGKLQISSGLLAAGLYCTSIYQLQFTLLTWTAFRLKTQGRAFRFSLMPETVEHCTHTQSSHLVEPQ